MVLRAALTPYTQKHSQSSAFFRVLSCSFIIFYFVIFLHFPSVYCSIFFIRGFTVNIRNFLIHYRWDFMAAASPLNFFYTQTQTYENTKHLGGEGGTATKQLIERTTKPLHCGATKMRKFSRCERLKRRTLKMLMPKYRSSNCAVKESSLFAVATFNFCFLSV